MDVQNREQFAKDFYSRQVTLKELGEEGQKKLCKATVAVVGVGGLGTVSSLYLTLAGVGNLRLIDQDVVETKNLHRQILYTPDDLDYPKAEVAAARLKKLNPLVNAKAFSENVNAGNVERLLAGVDLVVDGLDNMATRYLVNRACVKMKVPYVFGAAIGMEGNLSVFAPPKTPCLECMLPNLSDNDLLKCDTRGVLGATPGIIGAMQAFEAVKVLAKVGTPLKGKLMICDFNDMYFTTVDIAKRVKCPACEGTLPAALREKLVWLCGQNTANINPETPLKLNLAEVYEAAQQLGFHVRVKSRLALMFDYKGLEVSLFIDGRMLIKNVSNEKAALASYREILQKLNLKQ
ncbi:MAG: ThiF family adenylyltransferase [Candidatus Bathyarchaeota archaeon]|nr:ThiF family adenylyltransferase [Candidatus Bathyarchaeota archaeon]